MFKSMFQPKFEKTKEVNITEEIKKKGIISKTLQGLMLGTILFGAFEANAQYLKQDQETKANLSLLKQREAEAKKKNGKEVAADVNSSTLYRYNRAVPQENATLVSFVGGGDEIVVIDQNVDEPGGDKEISAFVDKNGDGNADFIAYYLKQQMEAKGDTLDLYQDFESLMSEDGLKKLNAEDVISMLNEMGFKVTEINEETAPAIVNMANALYNSTVHSTTLGGIDVNSASKL
jgi:hypothetical protein